MTRVCDTTPPSDQVCDKTHQGDVQRAPHVPRGAPPAQAGAHHLQQEQLAGPADRGAAGQAGDQPHRAPPQAAGRLADRGRHRHVQAPALPRGAAHRRGGQGQGKPAEDDLPGLYCPTEGVVL